jgi:AraC-like DNA-binding protein
VHATAHATAVALSGADEARESDSEPRCGRPKKHIVRRYESKESVVVLLEREHERRVVRDALSGEARVHFAEGPSEVHPPWRHEVPIAVLVEVHDERERRMERALGILRREAPDISRWAYAELEPGSVGVAVRLAARGLVADVITTGEDLGSRLRALLMSARVWSEGEALRKVWDEWAGPETRAIVGACIDASGGAATPRDVARQLDKSPRTLSRELSAQGLPSLARMIAFCRLLRAMYRLDHRDIKVKAVASELGYKYPSALSHQLRWFTGLSIASLPAGSRFATLAALVRAEIPAARDQVHASRGHGAASTERRRPKRATHGSEVREVSASI